MTRRYLVLIASFLVVSATSTTAQGVPAASAEPATVSAIEAASTDQDTVVSTTGGLPERAPQARTMRAYWHVFIAFAATWLLLFGYALTVGRRFGQLESELQRLASSRDAPPR